MGKKMDRLSFMLMIVVLLSVLPGCTPPTPAAAPPQVDITVNPVGPIDVGQQASIAANSSSEITSYSWSVSRGSLDNKNAPAVIYTAPQSPGQDIVTLIAKGPGGTNTKTVQLTINAPQPTSTPLPAVVQPTLPPSAPNPPGGAAATSGTTSSICSGNSSADYLSQAWAAFNGHNYPLLLTCAQGAIDNWTAEADSQQTKRLHENKCDITPDPSEKEAYFGSYWALSDIGAAWFLRGEAYSGMQNYPAARNAYKSAIDKYSCSYVWDNNGWFWRVKTAAQQKFDAIKDK